MTNPMKERILEKFDKNVPMLLTVKEELWFKSFLSSALDQVEADTLERVRDGVDAKYASTEMFSNDFYEGYRSALEKVLALSTPSDKKE